ncbi:unnamed protein product [Camellia sinensis]
MHLSENEGIEGKTFVVAGGLGFVGSSLCLEHLRRGAHQVRTFHLRTTSPCSHHLLNKGVHCIPDNHGVMTNRKEDLSAPIDIETNECVTNNGGCWQDKDANITACRDTFRGRLCQYPIVQGALRCELNNGGCWKKTQEGRTYSACIDNHTKGCKCPPRFEGDGVHTCEDMDECKERSACQCPQCKCKNTWGSYECRCGSNLLYMREHDTCINRESTQQQQHVDQNNASMELINSVTSTDEEGRSRHSDISLVELANETVKEDDRAVLLEGGGLQFLLMDETFLLENRLTLRAIFSAITSFKIHHDKSPISGKSILYLNKHQTEEWKGWMQHQVIPQITMHRKIKALVSLLSNVKRVLTRAQENPSQQFSFEMTWAAAAAAMLL